MPKQHQSLLQSLPSQRVRVGDSMVDLAAREITPASAGGDGAPHRMSLKAIDLLVVLIDHAGKVVSRETLLETVWPDTWPGDDVVTQAVAQLRKAFGSDEPYIETIAKHGYRLLAPVEWLDLPDAVEQTPLPAQPTAIPASPRARPGLRIIGTAAALAALGFALWLAIGADRERAQRVAGGSDEAAPPFLKITSAPGAEFAPSLSPDGSQVVYSAYVDVDGKGRTQLMLQTTAPVEPRALTHPVAGEQDLMSSWSPDGRQIAFYRVRRGAGPGSSCHLMLMASAGGEPHPVATCESDRLRMFGWHPDGKQLVFGASNAGQPGVNAIEVLDLAAGTSRKLDYAHAASDLDLAPKYSPDGRWIAFQRNVSRGDLWLVPAAGGQPERLTRIESNLYGLAWSPDGKSIVFSAYRGQEPSLLRLDVQSRRITELGIGNARFPSVALKDASVAFVIDETPTSLYRVRIPAQGEAVAAPEKVFPSSGSELLPSVSPDGRQIVFVSDRTGDVRLWSGEIGRATSLRPIENFIPFPRHPAAWSADGKTVLMIGTDGDNEALFEITPATGAVRKLALPQGRPTYGAYVAEPGRLLVVSDRGAGRLGLTLYQRSGEQLQPLATLDDVSLARFDPSSRRVVFFRNASWGLWQAGLSLDGPQMLDDLHADPGGSLPRIVPNAGFYLQSRRLVTSDRGNWIVAAGDGCNVRWVAVDAPAGSRSGPCLDSRGGELTGVSYDPASGWLYYSYSTGDASDIGWARLPEEPAR
jgi:Tol biopolymer transport system component/DNA-binding winged helix-turn-helix (wHTH) protein